MNNTYLVVVLDGSETIMSFVPFNDDLAKQINHDVNVAYDMALDAAIQIPDYLVGVAMTHVENFGKLENGSIVELSQELEDSLTLLSCLKC